MSHTENAESSSESDLCDDPIESLAEPWRKYTDNSFYPIFIGEEIDDRYKIVHKLGHGGFSTVWMAHDLVAKENVALKVSRAMNIVEEYASTIIPMDDSEVRIQDLLKCMLDCSNLIVYKRTFLLRGSGPCHHRVFVFPLLGPSLSDCWGAIDVKVAVPATSKILETLAQIHAAGLLHRGGYKPSLTSYISADSICIDLNLGNIMWGLKHAHHLSPQELYKRVGRPRIQVFDNELWKPGELVARMMIPTSMLTNELHIGDFGLTIRCDEAIPDNARCPAYCCAPELYFGQPPSFASDMWNFMYIFIYLYLRGRKPWYGEHPQDAVSAMTRALGPIPQEWRGHWQTRGREWDDWYNPGSFNPNDLADQVDRIRPDASMAERALFLSIVSKVTQYKPEKRYSAQELLRDKQFQELMNIYGS